MKLAFAAVLLVSAPLFAQQTGVSHPDEATIETSAGVQQVPVVSAPAIVVAPSASANAGGVASESPAVTLRHHDLKKFALATDPDAGIVGDEVVANPNEVAAGTLIRARLQTTIATASTLPGTPFRAQITEAVTHDGRVVVPAGALLEGRVTEVRGGSRLHGNALIHLQAQTIVLPDGSRMPLQASVVDTDQYASTRIDDEGNIVKKGHRAQTLATLGLVTGGAAAAGGVIAGPAGALVGAGLGAGVSTVMWLKADRQTQLPEDSLVVLALDSPLSIQPLVSEPNYSEKPSPAIPLAAAPATPEPQAFVPVN